ncbi:hypothetical protein JOB18_016982 [Solea senegalensis]|uniref:Uncharacterized protein n=1 Tax=Solea senegalensis TaxID=28829 RepID=A0AAV6S8X4_SOLSE|nr:hypothetical protein JOB18_016982 [Solea senegalensis]
MSESLAALLFVRMLETKASFKGSVNVTGDMFCPLSCYVKANRWPTIYYKYKRATFVQKREKEESSSRFFQQRGTLSTEPRRKRSSNKTSGFERGSLCSRRSAGN